MIKELEKEGQEYVQYQNFFDRFAAESITSHTLKLIFNVLLKLSYSIFLAAIAIIQTADLQSKTIFRNFISDSSNKTQIYILILLGVTILNLFKIFKEDNKISREKRKLINCQTDFLRVGTYTYLAIFLYDFVSQNQDEAVIVLAYWLLVAAAGLFAIRKLLKWGYYYLAGGREIYTPWENKYNFEPKLADEETKKWMDFFNKVVKKKEGDGPRESLLSNDKMR